MAVFFGTPDATGEAAQCMARANRKVPAGNLKAEGINWLRSLFDLDEYEELPPNIGYCAPTQTLERLTRGGGGESALETVMVVDEDELGSMRAGIHGLSSATLAPTTGDAAGVPAPVIDPPFGQETCGLVLGYETVQEFDVQLEGTTLAGGPGICSDFQWMMESSFPALANPTDRVTARKCLTTATAQVDLSFPEGWNVIDDLIGDRRTHNKLYNYLAKMSVDDGYGCDAVGATVDVLFCSPEDVECNLLSPGNEGIIVFSISSLDDASACFTVQPDRE